MSSANTITRFGGRCGAGADAQLANTAKAQSRARNDLIFMLLTTGHLPLERARVSVVLPAQPDHVEHQQHQQHDDRHDLTQIAIADVGGQHDQWRIDGEQRERPGHDHRDPETVQLAG